MNKTASVRNARTMATSAENKGRMDSFARAESDGIILQKEWIATRDNRTRDWHAELDGQLKDRNEPFVNSMGEIMYPGDPHADPANTYNCRCTLGSKILGFKKLTKGNTDLTSSVKSDKINIVLQFFAEKDIANQDSNSLQRAIRKYNKHITEHLNKINNPQQYIENWDNYTILQQQGLIKHWKKEINNFKNSVRDREIELKKRGNLK